MNSVIEFDHVTKIYNLGTKTSLREAFSNSVSGIFKNGGNPQKTVYSLNDVSFRVYEGEVLGIIGSNGAGKTTTLKLLSRVTYPTAGKIHVHGRVSALIELGAGFHPELTGAENIYLNASILGLKRDEIAGRFNKIVNFSGLDRFIDTPVKRYSSGMYARLAFSVAAHVDPDILLVDEVLSVGDELFQQKCFNRMREIRDMGRAMVFISHNMMAVKNICTRVIWLNQGVVLEDGDPDEVIGKYLYEQHSVAEKELSALNDGERLEKIESGVIQIREVKIENETGEKLEVIKRGAPVKVSVNINCAQQLNNPEIQMYFEDKHNERIIGDRLRFSDCDVSGFETNNLDISCLFETSLNRPNIYRLTVDILEDGHLIFRQKGLGPIIVMPDNQNMQMINYEMVGVPTQWFLNGKKIKKDR
jgi:ABC-type polysaccharide/polyol phosphate transport system ATPase subunit